MLLTYDPRGLSRNGLSERRPDLSLSYETGQLQLGGACPLVRGIAHDSNRARSSADKSLRTGSEKDTNTAVPTLEPTSTLMRLEAKRGSRVQAFDLPLLGRADRK
jgi:hypothetical protein